MLTNLCSQCYFTCLQSCVSCPQSSVLLTSLLYEDETQEGQHLKTLWYYYHKPWKRWWLTFSFTCIPEKRKRYNNSCIQKITQHFDPLLYISARPRIPRRNHKTNPNMTTTATAATSSSHPYRYNFLRGHPNTQLLPVMEMQQLLIKVAARQQQQKQDCDDTTTTTTTTTTTQSVGTHCPSFATSLNYLSSDQGDPTCLAQLQAFLERRTVDDETTVAENTTTTPLSLFWTHGVSHGLDLLCQALAQPGDVVWVERPTYFLAAEIFQSHHLHVQALPLQRGGGGMDVPALETALQTGILSPPRFVYLIPTHHNPTGRTLSLQDRIHLTRLARQYKFFILADEVYHLLDWTSKSATTTTTTRCAADTGHNDDHDNNNIPRRS